MTYKFESTLEKFQKNKIWSFHIKIPETIVSKFEKKDKRFVCTLNDFISFQCGLLSAGELGFFININASIRKKINLNLHDTLRISLKKDTSKYGLPIPKVFEELLKQDPDFDRVFHKLTAGKQRSLLHRIGNYKNENTQLEKLMILRNYLIQVKGRLDFKELSDVFRIKK